MSREPETRETKEGRELNRTRVGTRKFSDENNNNLNRTPVKPGVRKVGEGKLLVDGFTKIDESKIPSAVQSAFQDDGKHDKDTPSKTFSGHARGK